MKLSSNVYRCKTSLGLSVDEKLRNALQHHLIGTDLKYYSTLLFPCVFFLKEVKQVSVNYYGPHATDNYFDQNLTAVAYYCFLSLSP
jgi:hypothetical protein